jgi:hypothetical protein
MRFRIRLSGQDSKCCPTDRSARRDGRAAQSQDLKNHNLVLIIETSVSHTLILGENK